MVMAYMPDYITGYFLNGYFFVVLTQPGSHKIWRETTLTISPRFKTPKTASGAPGASVVIA